MHQLQHVKIKYIFGMCLIILNGERERERERERGKGGGSLHPIKGGRDANQKKVSSMLKPQIFDMV
jgi:hypothetical protein